MKNQNLTLQNTAIYAKSAKQIRSYHAFTPLICSYKDFNTLFSHIAKFMSSNTMTKANILPCIAFNHSFTHNFAYLSWNIRNRLFKKSYLLIQMLIFIE